MSNEINNNRIGFCAILVAIYFALTPIHQMLLLRNGSTINKYLSVFIVISILIKQILNFRSITFHTKITKVVIIITVYIVISTLWAISIESAINASISIIEYIFFTLIVCSTSWNDKEKKLFLTAIVFSCAIYAITLTRGDSESRAVLIGINEEKTDPNMLAANLAIGVIICLRAYLVARKAVVRWSSFALMMITLYGIVATGSRGGLIACIVGMAYTLMNNKVSAKQIVRIVFVIIIIILGYDFLVSGKSSINEAVIERFINEERVEGGNGRFKIWDQYLNMLSGQVYSILVGNGFGNAGWGYSVFYHTKWMPSTHSDLIELICEGGLILAVLIGWLVIKTWKISKSQRNTIGNAALIVSLVAGISLNCFGRYIWWNCIILAYIGVDCFENTEKINERKDISHIADNR